MHCCVDSPQYSVLIRPLVGQSEPRERGKPEGKT